MVQTAPALVPAVAGESTLRQRRRRSSASSTSSASSFAKVDWESHIANLTGPSTPSDKDTPPPSPLQLSADHSPLLSLPPDILVHNLIPHLSYPALLSLRLTHPYFYHSSLLYPSRASAIQLKVSWLRARHEQGLPALYQSRSLSFDLDLAFVNNADISQMLRREVRHGYCTAGMCGCRVVGLEGKWCPGPRTQTHWAADIQHVAVDIQHWVAGINPLDTLKAVSEVLAAMPRLLQEAALKLGWVGRNARWFVGAGLAEIGATVVLLGAVLVGSSAVALVASGVGLLAGLVILGMVSLVHPRVLGVYSALATWEGQILLALALAAACLVGFVLWVW